MHTSPSNKSYIGYTSYSIDKRLTAHLKESNQGSDRIFHKALRKYGVDNFKSEILHNDIVNVEEAKILEKFYIEKYNTLCINVNGYNMTKGGDGVQLFGKDNGMYGKTHRRS